MCLKRLTRGEDQILGKNFDFARLKNPGTAKENPLARVFDGCSAA